VSTYQLKTPVVFIIFKRHETTQKVFERIRQAKPPKLFVIADGPRPEVPGEIEQCAITRSIINGVDWDCQVFKQYSDVNLRSIRRVPSGLDWVFSQVEEAIILEDDCLPHPTFFQFCEELLHDYRHDERVMVISGQNVQFGKRRTPYSYYFSRYNHCWGWATWRRAWRYYDADMKLWPEIRDEGLLHDIFSSPREVKFWTDVFQSAYERKQWDWDMHWTFAAWIQNGLSILSEQNLISNLGFGSDGTNTLEITQHANLPTEALEFPLRHPPFKIRNVEADRFTQETLFDLPLPQRAQRKLRRIAKQLFARR
jgi:hypothetical protein